MAKKTRQEQRRKRQIHIRKRVAGTSERPRLNVFRSRTNIFAQIIDDELGKTLVSASSIDKEIKSTVKGKRGIEVAAIVGEEIAKRAKAAGVTKVVFDRAGYKYHGRVKALAEAARQGGLEF